MTVSPSRTVHLTTRKPNGCYCGKCLNFCLLYDCEVSVSPADGLRGLSECSCQREVSNIIIANLDETKFKFNTNEIFNGISKWFHSNLLMLNYDKTYFAIPN
jgi:hypothetical protein